MNVDESLAVLQGNLDGIDEPARQTSPIPPSPNLPRT